MKEYFKNYWKWLCLSLILPILLLVIMTFFNTDVYLTIVAVLIIILAIITLASIILAIVKRNRKFTTIFLVSFLSCLLVITYSMTVAPQYYAHNSELAVNVFQKHELNKGSKQLKEIKSAIKDSDNISKTKTAKANLKQLKQRIKKDSNSKSANESLNYTYNDLTNALDGKPHSATTQVNLFILSAEYAACILKEHYTNKQIKQDDGKFIQHFTELSGTSI